MSSTTALPEMGFSLPSSLYPLYPTPRAEAVATKRPTTLPEQGFTIGQHHQQLYPAPGRPPVPASASASSVPVGRPSSVPIPVPAAAASTSVPGSSPAAGDTSESKRLKATVDALERRLIAREDVIAAMTRDKKKQDAVIEQLQRDIQAHITRHADLSRELEAEEAQSSERQTKIADLVQHSVRFQEALVVVQSQLNDAKQVISIYEDRISRLEYDVVSKQFPIPTAEVPDTVDFSRGTYPNMHQSASLPYDLIYAGNNEDEEGVEESKNGHEYGHGHEDGDEYSNGDGDEYSNRDVDDDQSEAAETDCSEGAAEIGRDSARDSATNSEDSDNHDDARSLDTETETESDAVDDDAHGDHTDTTAHVGTTNDSDDLSAALKAPTVPSSTTRRVILKKGGGGHDGTKSVVGSAPTASAAVSVSGTGHDDTIAARVKAMSARDMSRLTVPELTQLLEGLGKGYCKPKAAAVALLMTIAKDL